MINLARSTEQAIMFPRESTSLHPSEIGGCVRQTYYRARGYAVTSPRDLGSSWFLERYSWYEQLFIKAAIKEGIYVWPPAGQSQHEVRLGKWSGKLDLVIEDWNGLAIVEVKSVNPGALNRGNIPYDHHIEQAQVYWIMTQDPCLFPSRKVMSAYLQYIERWDEGKVPRIPEAIDVTPTQEEAEDLRAKMQDIEGLMEENSPPFRPYDNAETHAWNCTAYNYKSKMREIRCPFLATCWGSGIAMRYGQPF